jgi:CheY-like chemotaxis protein
VIATIRGGKGARADARGQRLRAPADRGMRPSFLAACEAPPLVEHLRLLLDGLLGPTDIEVIPSDGPVVLARLRGARVRLAFVSMEMRGMDGLTLLRALPGSRGRQVVLLVPDTLEGYRVAWEGLARGAKDFLVSKGAPPLRFRGSVGHRLRQLASLLAMDAGGNETHPTLSGVRTVPGSLTAGRTPLEEAPWVVVAETWNLILVTEWLSRQAWDAPVVIRLPEGPRLLRVARESLGRLGDWPVRSLVSGDRLVRGHIHLVAGTETISLEKRDGHLVARVRLAAGPPGSWGAYHDLLQSLGESDTPIRILLPEPGDPEEEALLVGEGPLHAVYHLERCAEARALPEEAVLPLSAWGGKRRAA